MLHTLTNLSVDVAMIDMTNFLSDDISIASSMLWTVVCAAVAYVTRMLLAIVCLWLMVLASLYVLRGPYLQLRIILLKPWLCLFYVCFVPWWAATLVVIYQWTTGCSWWLSTLLAIWCVDRMLRPHPPALFSSMFGLLMTQILPIVYYHHSGHTNACRFSAHMMMGVVLCMLVALATVHLLQYGR
jgi:hypothetical protein